MSVAAALVAGGVFGVRHALETDHLAAVATLVEKDKGVARTGLVGASWGVGHSIPVVVLGLAFFLLGIRLPEGIVTLFEALVGLVLVYLGGRLLVDIFGPVRFQRHTHDPRNNHAHLQFGPFSLGSSHSHVDDRSFAIGAIHGFAGSGALVILLVSASPSLDAALAFLVAFSLLSIVTMSAVSVVWGRALGTGLTRYLKVGAGLVGVGVGLLLVVEQLGSFGLL